MAEKLITIDLAPLKARVLASLPHSADRDRILKGLAQSAMRHWRNLAQKRLRSSSKTYLDGLSIEESGGTSKLTLDGVLPNMVELGWQGGDMRQWMLQSGKAKQGKNGPYLVIPFRHGTPGTSGRNVGKQMPGAIHAEAKKLSHTLSRPGPPVSSHGGRLKVHGQALHPHKGMQQQARDILESKQKPWHSTSIYTGMIRKGQKTKSGVQTSGYQTFRTISQHTNEEGKHWVHPGIKPRMLHRDVKRFIGRQVHAIIKTAMQGRK